MHGTIHRHVDAGLQGPPRKKYADETPKQRADHREIEQRYRKKRRGAKTYRRIRELEIIFADRYGAVLPERGARVDLIILLHHVARLGDPSAFEVYKTRWFPWISNDDLADLVAMVKRKPLRWKADPLADELDLDYATRTRLGITTIGAVDFSKRQRTRRRRKLNNDKKRLKRVQAGATPHAVSEARLKPWLALGISESTYRRRKRRDSNSGTAYPKGIGASGESLSPDRRAAPRGRLSARGASGVGRGESLLYG
jgi:hypothetical protein